MRCFAALLVALVHFVPLRAARADYMDHFAQRSDVGPRKVPYLGPARLMLIPVEVAGHPALDRPQLQRFFSEEDPQGFVRYFRTASRGRYQPEVTVAPTVHFDECPLPPQQFPNCAVARGDIAALTGGMDMIREVIRRADGLGVDFAAHDVNGRDGRPDRFADGVMILANVPFGGIAFPFAFFNQGDNLAGGTGGPLMVDGIRIPHVAIAGEGDSRVMIHEFGHLLGLTDLYDESGQYDGLHLSFMGAWSYGPKIPLPDAETRYRLRWANLLQVRGPGRMRLRPAETSGEVLRFGAGDEYFLVENRGPGGAFDAEFTERGLVVYHVDRTVRLRGEEGRFVDRLANCVNCDPWHPYIRIIEADGRDDLQRGGRPDFAQDLFRNGAAFIPPQSNLYSGAQTGFGLWDITVLEDGSVAFTVDAPAQDACVDLLCEDGPGCQPVNCADPSAGRAEEEGSGCGCQAATGVSSTLAWAAILTLIGRSALRRRLGGPTSSGTRLRRRQGGPPSGIRQWCRPRPVGRIRRSWRPPCRRGPRRRAPCTPSPPSGRSACSAGRRVARRHIPDRCRAGPPGCLQCPTSGHSFRKPPWDFPSGASLQCAPFSETGEPPRCAA